MASKSAENYILAIKGLKIWNTVHKGVKNLDQLMLLGGLLAAILKIVSRGASRGRK